MTARAASMNAVIARLAARLRSVKAETGSVVPNATGSATKFHAFAQFRTKLSGNAVTKSPLVKSCRRSIIE